MINDGCNSKTLKRATSNGRILGHRPFSFVIQDNIMKGATFNWGERRYKYGTITYRKLMIITLRYHNRVRIVRKLIRICLCLLLSSDWWLNTLIFIFYLLEKIAIGNNIRVTGNKSDRKY